MIEHLVIVEEIGGMDVISCPSLDLKHIEHSGEVNPNTIKKTILHHFRYNKDDSRSDFGISIEDRRPEITENYNEQRKRESLQNRPKNRNFI